MLPDSISTHRLTVRRYAPGEGQLVFDLVRNNIDRFRDAFPTFINALLAGSDPEAWISEKVRDWNTRTSFYFGIWDANTNTYIGQVSIKNLENGAPVAEMGYYLDAAWSGKGLMTEAMEAVLGFGFEQLGMHLLYLRIAVENHASNRLAQKLGFVCDRTITDGFETMDGKLLDIYFHKLPVDSFLERKTGKASG